MLYIEKWKGVVCEIMCVMFRWWGDYHVWVFLALADGRSSLANQPWHISVARWLEIGALVQIETNNESGEDSINALGW